MYDAMGITGILKESVEPVVKYDLLSMDEFYNMVNDFLYHIIWASKKIQRGELWTAKMCIDAYLKRYLLRVMEMYTITVRKNLFPRTIVMEWFMWNSSKMMKYP